MGDPIDPVELAASVMIPSEEASSARFNANIDMASIKSGGSELLKSPVGQVLGVFLAIMFILYMVRPGFVRKRRKPGQGEGSVSLNSLALYGLLFTLPVGLYMVAPQFVSGSLGYVRNAIKSAGEKTAEATA